MVFVYTIKKEGCITFHNNATLCIGTGRMNLALRKVYHDQLQKVQKDIGFAYIRGHGLFCDDMAIYQTYKEGEEEKVEYNFTYLDLVFDDYQSLGLKPFIELGFMPDQLASGNQTIFYWKGNVTPPSDYNKWADLIKATIFHWIERYGREEVITWSFEVWNEPNLTAFWKNADMQEYFRLYDVSSRAVKECDPQIRVGGPAICGVDDERWLNMFLEHCSRNKLPVDFATRHAYAAEAPDINGHYAYQKLRSPEVFLNELRISRRIIDSFPEYAGMVMHITEFNTSYSPQCPIHDTNLNAAYIARLLSEMGDVCASYSYWTFGDVFEENGVAFTPFSGCFGLLAYGMIQKPTYWAFEFFSKIGSTAMLREKNLIITKECEGNYHGVVWNPVEDNIDRKLELHLQIELENGDYAIITKLVDEFTCNPLKIWIDLGSPANPTKEQMELTRAGSYPQITTNKRRVSENTLQLNYQLTANALLYINIQRIHPVSDRGYCPDRVRGAV